MSNLVVKEVFHKKQLEKFHSVCRENCSSKKRFEQTFVVSRKHVLNAGLAKQAKRLSLSDQDIAAAIRFGFINFEKSSRMGGIDEIALECLFLNYSWTDQSGGKIELRTEESVQIRVIVRRQTPKNKVVTIYIEEIEKLSNLQEVKADERQIWD